MSEGIRQNSPVSLVQGMSVFVTCVVKADLSNKGDLTVY